MIHASNFARVLALVLLGAAAAALSNLGASTERKLAWVGNYPRALELAAPPSGAAPVPAPRPAEPAASSPAPAPASHPPAQARAPAAPAPLDADLSRAFPPHPDKPAIEISPGDVQLLYGRKALFLDARRSSVYEEGHIAGARSFPVWESDIDSRVKALYEEGLDQRAPIVAYCSGGNCEDSHMLAEKLYMVGFDNVLVYKDGFPDWQKRGLPVNRGASP